MRTIEDGYRLEEQQYAGDAGVAEQSRGHEAAPHPYWVVTEGCSDTVYILPHDMYAQVWHA